MTISGATARSLLALGQTVGQIEQTTQRLSTGLKVNNPADDPGAYLTAENLRNQRSVNDGYLDGINQGAQGVQTAIDGLTAVRELLAQLQSLAIQAAASTDSALRQTLGSSFDLIADQINRVTADAQYNGTTLINGSGLTLDIRFSSTASSSIAVASFDARDTAILNQASIAYSAAAGQAAAFQASQANANSALAAVNLAISQVNAQTASFAAQLGLVQARSTLNSTLSANLDEGVNALVQADLNEEGARLLALQTLQSLAVNAINVQVGNASNIVGLSTGFRGN